MLDFYVVFTMILGRVNSCVSLGLKFISKSQFKCSLHISLFDLERAKYRIK